MIISPSHLSTASPASINPKNAGSDASPAGDFSAAFTKLFNPAHTTSGNAPAEGTSSHGSGRSRSTDQDSSPKTQQHTSEVGFDSYTPQTPAPQLPPSPVNGALPFGTVADPGAPLDSSLDAVTPVSTPVNNGSAVSGVQGSAIAATQQHGVLVADPSGPAIGSAGALDTQTPSLPTGAGNDVSAGDSSAIDAPDGPSDHIFGPSQEETGVSPAPQPPVVLTPASSSDAILAAVRATNSGNLPSMSNDAPIEATPVIAAIPAKTPAAATPAPAPSPRTLTSHGASAQPVPSVPAQMAPVPVPQPNETVVPQSTRPTVNSSVRTAPSRRADNAATPVPQESDASLQNSLDNAGISSITSITNNSAAAADPSAAKQDSRSADSDRQVKDDAIAGVAGAVLQAPILQSTPTPLQMASNPISHPVLQSPVATSSSPASSGSTSTNLADLDPSAAADAKTVINTSKLIQTLHQSEMRVGMRSSEFGDISIRTSAAHDNIITHISLDHPELARSLATQVPDMQAQLAGHGNHEIRINANDQNTGTNSTMSDARSGSQGGQQQEQASPSYFAPSYSSSPLFDSALPTATLANNLQNVWQNGRLDIQA